MVTLKEVIVVAYYRGSILLFYYKGHFAGSALDILAVKIKHDPKYFSELKSVYLTKTEGVYYYCKSISGKRSKYLYFCHTVTKMDLANCTSSNCTQGGSVTSVLYCRFRVHLRLFKITVMCM